VPPVASSSLFDDDNYDEDEEEEEPQKEPERVDTNIELQTTSLSGSRICIFVLTFVCSALFKLKCHQI
ncbi:hypothetical protein Tco_0636641, partial [Tanacetum coccineum]